MLARTYRTHASGCRARPAAAKPLAIPSPSRSLKTRVCGMRSALPSTVNHAFIGSHTDPGVNSDRDQLLTPPVVLGRCTGAVSTAVVTAFRVVSSKHDSLLRHLADDSNSLRLSRICGCLWSEHFLEMTNERTPLESSRVYPRLLHSTRGICSAAFQALQRLADQRQLASERGELITTDRDGRRHAFIVRGRRRGRDEHARQDAG